MPAFKPAYLIHGDDHGRIAERRARLRAVAEAESGAGGVELLEGEQCRPDLVADALSAMTFSFGRRFVIADGVERWKEKDIEPLAQTMAGTGDVATVAFFAREEGRNQAPEALHAAVKKVGGVVAAEQTVKPKDLSRWVQQRAQECGLELESSAAKALVAQVGDRQQRLLREVEKLALDLEPGARVSAEAIQEACASSSERKVWTLSDALVAGDARSAMGALVELRGQGERLPGLMYGIVRQLRDALVIAEALAAGKPPSEIKRGLRMPSWKADRVIADVRERDVEAYRTALGVMADLELETRGGGVTGLGEETMGVRAVLAVAS